MDSLSTPLSLYPCGNVFGDLLFTLVPRASRLHATLIACTCSVHTRADVRPDGLSKKCVCGSERCNENDCDETYKLTVATSQMGDERKTRRTILSEEASFKQRVRLKWG